jgi:hypothetical protein
MSNSTGPRQHVSKSAKSSPFFVLSKLPVCGSEQQLLGGAPVCDRPPQISQCVAEKLPVPVSERLSVVAAPKKPVSLRDSVREVRRRDIDLPHAGMQPLERVCVLGWRDLSRRHTFVVGPQRDHEAVTHVDARLHSRLKRSQRALGFRESLSKLDFDAAPG